MKNCVRKNNEFDKKPFLNAYFYNEIFNLLTNQTVSQLIDEKPGTEEPDFGNPQRSSLNPKKFCHQASYVKSSTSIRHNPYMMTKKSMASSRQDKEKLSTIYEDTVKTGNDEKQIESSSEKLIKAEKDNEKKSEANKNNKKDFIEKQNQ